jgi:hypothetical protein
MERNLCYATCVVGRGALAPLPEGHVALECFVGLCKTGHGPAGFGDNGLASVAEASAGIFFAFHGIRINGLAPSYTKND